MLPREPRTLESVVRAGDERNRLSQLLEERSRPLVVMFLDLVGSTQLKCSKPQEHWLVEICRFLAAASQCVQQHNGRVVKYIGDEVMAVFEDSASGLAANRAESCVLECEANFAELESRPKARYALDYGTCAIIDFENAPGDVLGTPVDRCARIAKLAASGCVVASSEFVAKSKRRAEWHELGCFSFKGLADPQPVFQLSEVGQPMRIANPDLITSSSDVLAAEIVDLRKQLEGCRQELRIWRTK